MKEVDLDEFKRCVMYFRKINEPPLKEIRFTRKGKEVKPDTDELKKLYDDFDCIGLMNTDYAKMLIGLM